MTQEYEHNGVVYNEPLPRIVLIAYGIATAEALRAKGHNVKEAKLVTIKQTERTGVVVPAPPIETDVLIVRDVIRFSYLDKIYVETRPAKDYVHHSPFGSLVRWPSGHQENFQGFCLKVVGHGGFCVFLLAEQIGGMLSDSSLGISELPNQKLWPGKTSHTLSRPEGYDSFTTFVARHLRDTAVYVGLDTSIGTVPFVKDAAGVPYVALRHVTAGATKKQGGIIVLPDYRDSIAVLHEFLSEVLPDVAPHLTPFRYDMSWLKTPEFRHPRITILEEEKDRIQSDAETKLGTVDVEIRRIEEEAKFLVDLLTADGETLKNAVKRTLEEILQHVGAVSVKVLDVDADPSLRGGSKDKREDLRIEWGEEIFLFDVAGREVHFRPTSLNQLSQHRRRFLSASRAPVDRIRSILIGNFNYRGGLDPRKRGDMFGTGTTEAKDRLLAEGCAAFGTYVLYQLLRAIQHGSLTLTPEELKGLLSIHGLVEYDEWLRALRSPVSHGIRTAPQGS